MEIDFSYKFQPLFELLDDKVHPEVDTVIITGGRGSEKSFAVSTFSAVGLVEYHCNILYTRFTNLSITDSVKPEVDEKIELLGYETRVVNTNTHIYTNKARIAFKGIKTGSKQQTANLKSLTGFDKFIVDEAEEIPDYETFKKVYYSIRSSDKRNLSILILNPTTSTHWIYEEFFERRVIESGYNGVKGNVMYIHVSYLDANPKHLAKNIRRDYERLKEDNPTEYENIVLGGWITEPEGVLLPLSKLRFEDLYNIPEENIVYKFACGDPADKGGDHFCIPFLHVAVVDGTLSCFVKDVIHTQDGIEVTNQRAIDKSRTLHIEDIFLEVNGVGTGAYYLLKRDLANHANIKPFNSRINKEVRILSHYEFVGKYFVFDKNYKSNPEYKKFIDHVTGYKKDDDQANKNKKDGLDALCSAANVLKLKYKALLYG